MNRLQKKCVWGTAGVHLLLLLILLVGPAFFRPRHQADEQLHILDVIPSNLIDAQFSSGVRHAQPPPPAPTPPAPQPQPVVAQPPPTPAPEPVVKPEPVKPVRETVKPDLKRVEKPVKTESHKIQVNLKQVVRGQPKNVRNDTERARALRNAIRSLKKDFSPSTMVDMPGTGTAAYANYRDVIGSIYYEAWTLPTDTSSDDADIKARIVVANDGTVVSARIITPSGDASADDSVRRTLERVTFIAPFPEGMTEKERSFIIDFNLKTKRMLE